MSNDYVAQEGGDHYQADYQHWDWVIDCKVHYLAGNCTKYLSRWQKKNGVEDLRKAMSYLEKMIVVRKKSPDYVFNHGAPDIVRICTNRLCESLGLNDIERSIFELVSGPCSMKMLLLAYSQLKELITTSQMAVEAQLGTAAPAPHGPASRPPEDVPGRVCGAITKAPMPSASTGVARKPSLGMEHPFGYDEAAELGFRKE